MYLRFMFNIYILQSTSLVIISTYYFADFEVKLQALCTAAVPGAAAVVYDIHMYIHTYIHMYICTIIVTSTTTTHSPVPVAGPSGSVK